MRQKIKKFVLIFLLTYSSTYLLTVVYCDTANIVVDAGSHLGSISPYVYGHNTGGVYYKPPMTDPAMIAKIKRAGITMLRFPPGAVGCRYDFKYNNYKGRHFTYSHVTNLSATGWWIENENYVTSLEEELIFCATVQAEPFVELNTAFEGPNGTGTDSNRWGGDFASYTGYPGQDTPDTRAQYALDMVDYIHTLCQSKGWNDPVYYNIGNEFTWEGQTFESYAGCFKAYVTAIKGKYPGLKLFGIGLDVSIVSPNPLQLTDYYDVHTYLSTGLEVSVFAPGGWDGAYPLKGMKHQTDIVGTGTSAYVAQNPGKQPIFTSSEYGDDAGSSNGSQFGTYLGAIYEAHTLYRHIKNKFFISCPWSMWSDRDTQDALFGGLPSFKERPRYFVYMIYKNFGNQMVECYDKTEYTSRNCVPGSNDYFSKYKDDSDDLLTQASLREDGKLAIVAINLSDSTTYQVQIDLQNFGMTGNITAYTMDETNCYEGGPGPSSTVLTGQANPVFYTFRPFTMTCLVLDSSSDNTPPSAIATVNDGTGTDIDSMSSTNPASLSANWTASTDAETGIMRYLYAIGTVSGAANVLTWTNNGTARSVMKTGLSLVNGQKYYFSVKAQNGAGLFSGSSSSDGQAASISGTIVSTTTQSGIYPNPYSLSGSGGMKIKVSGQGELSIYTLSGKSVRKVSGTNEITWNATNEDGEKVARGIYAYIITDTEGTRTGRIALK